MTAVTFLTEQATTFLCDADEVAEAGVKCVRLPNRHPIAVFRIRGQFYATDDRCTHAAASLSQGDIDGDVVTCPVHSGAFHIPTGKALCFPVTEDLKTYRVVVKEGKVFAVFADRAVSDGANS